MSSVAVLQSVQTDGTPRWKVALHLLHEMRLKEVSPNTATYNSVPRKSLKSETEISEKAPGFWGFWGFWGFLLVSIVTWLTCQCPQRQQDAVIWGNRSLPWCWSLAPGSKKDWHQIEKLWKDVNKSTLIIENKFDRIVSGRQVFLAIKQSNPITCGSFCSYLRCTRILDHWT